MKQHFDIQHEGTLGDEGRQRMTFDEYSVAHLMAILTDLYSDPELAVIREYSTNALDSHRAAGSTAPIRVSSPNALSPMFIVKDYGVGMSVDDIYNHFSKYGWSSKRDTDNEVGMLGLGCKCALTYTSQFTLVAIKGGVQATVLVTRETDGTGAVQVMDTVHSDHPDGVEIRIPVKNPYSFVRKMVEFFRFWDMGTVLVDGEAPECVWDKTGDYQGASAVWLDDDTLLTSGMSADYLVMGNVPYPIAVDKYGDQSKRLIKSRSHQAIVRVPIGAINFVPSREQLQYTKRTTEYCTAVQERIRKGLDQVIQTAIDAAPTHLEAMVAASKWINLSATPLTYRGDPIPDWFGPATFAHPDGYDEYERMYQWRLTHRTDDMSSRIHQIAKHDLENAIFLTGYKRNGVTQDTKQQLNIWAEEQKLSRRVVYIMDTPIPGPWVAHVPTVDYSVLRQIPIPGRVKPERGKNTYKRLSRTGNLLYEEQLPDNKLPLVYIKAQDRTAVQDRLAYIMPILTPLVNVIVLNENQVKKFLRENPDVVSLAAWLQQYGETLVETLTEAERYALHDTGTYDRSLLRHLKPDQVFDPELVALKAEFSRNRDSTQAWNDFIAVARLFNVKAPEVPPSTLGRKLSRIMKRYPLLNSYSYSFSGNPNDLVEYVNALYSVNCFIGKHD